MPFDVLQRLLRPMSRRPVTSSYPDHPLRLPSEVRGLPELDADRCDGTAACAAICPTQAISLAGPVWVLDAGKCVMCGACVAVCPRDALRLGEQVELATLDRSQLIVTRTWRDGP